MNSTDPQPLSAVQIISSIIFALSCASSLVAYVLVIVVIILYFKEFKSNFYIIVISLGIADMAYLALVLFYMVPSTMLKRDIWSSTPYAAGLIEMLSYFAQCTHLTYIAFNRLMYSCATGAKNPTLDKLFNTKQAATIWLIILWAGGCAVPTVVQIAGCDCLYDFESMAFINICRDVISKRFSEQALLGDTIIAGGLPASITILHVLAWLAVYFKGRQSGNASSAEFANQRKRETRLLIQFTLISLAFILAYLSFWAIPHWFNSTQGLVLITYFGIASCAVNPFTYLAYNKLMKTKAEHLVCKVLMRRKDKNANTSNASQATSTTRVRPITVK